MSKYIKVIFTMGLGILISACERASEPQPVTEPTFTNIQDNIFSLNCALSGCHAGSSPQQGMNLSEGQAYNNIVNVPSNEMPNLLRINPNNPDQSYLFLKIQGDPSIIGERMPLGRPPLSAEQIDLIRRWILDGAPNN